MTPINAERLARHYVWMCLLFRAGPIPEALLREVAYATASQVPKMEDPVASVEWHLEKIIEVARQMIAAAPASVEPPVTDWPPMIRYKRDMPVVGHADEDGPLCVTTLPAAVCGCGRYGLICVDPDPSPG